MKTIGTDLYAIDPLTFAILAVGCFTSLDGIDTTLAQIDVTCMQSTAREYEAGLAEPGSATFGLNIDVQNAAHIRLHQLKKSGTKLLWAVGWGDGVVPPTVEPAPGTDGVRDFVLPESRTWLTFDGYMNSFPFAFALGDVVKSTVGIQVSGDIGLIPKVIPAP